MKRGLILFSIIVFVFVLAAPADALTVSTRDCSAIDTTDGDTADWSDITYLVNRDADKVSGTTHYYKPKSKIWTTDRPANPAYSVNLDQWADITRMKICNTADDFFLMLQTEWPMFTYYDHAKDLYIDFWWPIGAQESEFLSMPGNFDYWMVWKMQDVAAEGAVIYFAADISMKAGNSEMETDHPKLYLYEESDVAADFLTADFNPKQDIKLTTIAVSDNGDGTGEGFDCDPQDPQCQPVEPEDVGFATKKSQAFEIRQKITKLFKYADFSYTDKVNISVATYNAANFGASSLGMTKVDEINSGEYKWSKKGVRKVNKVTGTRTKTSIRLRWREFKNVRSYWIKVYNTENDNLVRTIKRVKKNRKTVKNLKSGKKYRAIVRAIKKGSFTSKKKRRSAWSSGFNWTTR